MKHAILLFSLFAIPAFSQTADCSQSQIFSTATSGTSLPANSGGPNGCAFWKLTWQVTGFSAATIALQGSQDGSSWSNINSSLIQFSGANPTSWTNSTTSNMIAAIAYFPFVRVNVSSVTGSGTIATLILGTKVFTAGGLGSGGGGGCTVTLTGDVTGSGACTGITTTLAKLHPYTVASLPVSTAPGTVAYVTDGASASDCFVGGGTFKVLCVQTGTGYTFPGPASTSVQIQQAGVPQGAASTLNFTTNMTASVTAGVATIAATGGGGGSGGSGVTVYSGLAGIALSGTTFFPIGGGSIASTTETSVQAIVQGAYTVQNFGVQLSAALGAGNSVVFTWRKNASSQTVTCTISGASATTCADTTHSFSTVATDLVDIQAVFTGTIVVAPNFVMNASMGGSGGGGGTVYAFGVVTTPPTTGWTTENLCGGTFAANAGMWEVTGSACNAINISTSYRTAPSTPFTVDTVTYLEDPYVAPNVFVAPILGIRDSAGKYVSFASGSSFSLGTGPVYANTEIWNSATSRASAPSTAGPGSYFHSFQNPVYWRMVVSSTTITFFTSINAGLTWFQFGSPITISGNLADTASIAWGIENEGTATNIGAMLVSFLVH